METAFKIGQTVRSKVDAQKLTKGGEYVVLDLETSSNFLGTYVTYLLVPLGAENSPKIPVGNGHLVLERV